MSSNIDEEIKELIFILNKLPGIKTWKSCAGHSSDIWSYVEGYVSFTVESQDDLKHLLLCLPFEEFDITFIENTYKMQRLHCSCNYSQNIKPGQVIYKLTFGGQPVFYQRKLIADLIVALKTSPFVRQHLPLTKHGSGHRQDNSLNDCFSSFSKGLIQKFSYLLQRLWELACLFLDTLSLLLPSHHFQKYFIHLLMYPRTTPICKWDR